MVESMFFTLPPFLISFEFLQFNWWSSPVSNAVPGIQTELYNNRQEIAEKEMPAKLCQHEQDKTILALGPGLFNQSIFGYLPRKKAEERNVILHII